VLPLDDFFSVTSAEICVTFDPAVHRPGTDRVPRSIRIAAAAKHEPGELFEPRSR
jgi:hypothetical protein